MLGVLTAGKGCGEGDGKSARGARYLKRPSGSLENERRHAGNLFEEKLAREGT